MSVWTTPTQVDPKRRVPAPNSVAREVLVIALDKESAAYGRDFADEQWKSTEWSGFDGIGGTTTWDQALASHARDMVVLMTSGTLDRDMVDRIGAHCERHAIKLAVLFVSGARARTEHQTALQVVRPWANTVAVIDDGHAVIGMLHGLGA